MEPQVALVGADGVPGPFTSMGLFTSSRKIPVNHQIPGPGCLSIREGRAIGGLTGYSDWSDVVARRWRS